MTGCSENIEFRDVDSWQVLNSFPGQLGVLSKTGALLVTANSSPFFNEPAGKVILWNWRTGQLLRHLDRSGRALALSADSQLFAMVDPNWNLTVWDTATGKLVHEWPMKHPIWSLDFSPDGRKIIAAGWSREVSVWSLDSQSLPQIIKSQRLTIWSAEFSKNGTRIATTGTDRRVRLWDAAAFEAKSVLHGHDSEIWCAAFSPDDKLLATGGPDNQVMLWPTALGALQNKLPHDANYRPIFSPDGISLVTVDPVSQNCMLWDVDRHTLITPQLAGGRFIFGFSRNGKQVVTFEANQWSLQFWRPTGTDPEKEIVLQGKNPAPARFNFIAMSPGQEFIFAIDEIGLIRVWDTDTGHLLHMLKGPVPPIRNAVMSPGGKYLAVSIDRENIARLYDCAKGMERQLAGHLDFVSGLSFSPDGLTLATSSMDGSIRLWSTTTGKFLVSFPAHMGEVSDVAFSPDGRTLASLGRRLVKTARARWRVEMDYRELKEELGLDHYEGRHWLGWHHHVTLVSIAFAFLRSEQAQAKKNFWCDVDDAAPDPSTPARQADSPRRTVPVV